jgi:hypothetical protein
MPVCSPCLGCGSGAFRPPLAGLQVKCKSCFASLILQLLCCVIFPTLCACELPVHGAAVQHDA